MRFAGEDRMWRRSLSSPATHSQLSTVDCELPRQASRQFTVESVRVATSPRSASVVYAVFEKLIRGRYPSRARTRSRRSVDTS
jgi:hypothetical protein